MNRLTAVYELTQDLHDVLHQEFHPEKRSEMIEKVNQLIVERGRLLVDIQPPFSVEEQQVGEELIPLDKQAQNKLNELFSDLKTEIRSMKKQKTSNAKYKNPYQNLASMDGMFLDHKK